MTRRGPVTSWEVDVPLPTPRQSESRARGHIPTQLPGPSCSRTTSSQRARRRLPPGVRPGRPRKGRLVTGEGITGPGKEGSGGVSRYRQAHPHGDSLTHTLGGALHGPGDGGSHLARSRATLQTACIPEASWASWHCCGATKSELRVAGCILYPTAAVLLAGEGVGGALAGVSGPRGTSGQGRSSAGPTAPPSGSLIPRGVSGPKEEGLPEDARTAVMTDAELDPQHPCHQAQDFLHVATFFDQTQSLRWDVE